MYNTSLKHKWDNKNVLDYAVAQAEQRATERERTKALEEKRGTAIKLKKNKVALEIIAEATGLTIQEIEAL